MATSQASVGISLTAGAAFVEADFGKLVTVTAENTVSLVSGTTQTVAGILGLAPVASGEVVTVATLNGSINKFRCGGAVAVGQVLVPAADGRVTAVADINAIPADTMGVGIALSAGVAGDIISGIALPLVSTLSA